MQSQKSSKKQVKEVLDRISERLDISKPRPRFGSLVAPTGLKKTDQQVWAEIRNRKGEIIGYIQLFWGGKLGWVSIPGASQVIDARSGAKQ